MVVNADARQPADTRCRIVVYGDSAWLTGIATALHATSGMEVQCLASLQVSNPLALTVYKPHILIIERECGNGPALHLHLKIPVIEVDASRNVLTIHTTQQVVVASIQELIQIIEDIAPVSAPPHALPSQEVA